MENTNGVVSLKATDAEVDTHCVRQNSSFSCGVMCYRPRGSSYDVCQRNRFASRCCRSACQLLRSIRSSDPSLPILNPHCTGFSIVVLDVLIFWYAALILRFAESLSRMATVLPLDRSSAAECGPKLFTYCRTSSEALFGIPCGKGAFLSLWSPARWACAHSFVTTETLKFCQGKVAELINSGQVTYAAARKASSICLPFCFF